MDSATHAALMAAISAANPLWSERHVRYMLELMPSTNAWTEPHGTVRRAQLEREFAYRLHRWKQEVGLISAEIWTPDINTPPIVDRAQEDEMSAVQMHKRRLAQLQAAGDEVTIAHESKEFDTQDDAKAYIAEHNLGKYVAFGLLDVKVTPHRHWFQIRPENWAIASGSAGATRAPVAKREGGGGPTKKGQVLEMLQAGPVTIEQVMAKFSCTSAAASALFGDVKRMGHPVRRTGNVYDLG